MVNLEAILQTVNELSLFFSDVIESPATSDTDKKSAAYGLEKVHTIKELVKQYQEKPSNVILKRIHNTFQSATRGVEGFIDLQLNDRFHRKAGPTYYIMQDLIKNIKW